ncbi:recombinase family protein [Paenibacillus residui]|uniref:Recombinase family protein n=1 Tax=Paenibacillus residui TaxID=629724 RepID=A0ABW3D7U0_9BACL
MFKLPSGEYAAYLRKSRVDLEAEARGEEDTYKRHMQILLELTKRHGITLSKIYKEKPATSGERISERPQMIQLLEDVENEMWTGILVVEVERLARGDTMDQGIVAQAFKYSDTLIVTPMRIYDPQNPDDEEYFEFGLFMSRREFKTTTRRLQGGRADAVKDGRYAGSKPPYGYDRKKLPGKGYTLVPNPDQAPIIKMIFDMYVREGKGTGLIARRLNELAVPTARNSIWTLQTINGMIRNPVYMGKIAWNRRPTKRRRKDGILQLSRPRADRKDWLLYQGRHEAIVDEKTWEKAQEILESKDITPAPTGIITNPLAGLIRCDICGRSMVRRPYHNRPAAIMCATSLCKNVSSELDLVEDRLLEGLRIWLKDYKAQWMEKKPRETAPKEDMLEAKLNILKSAEKLLTELINQKDNLHDLLERKIYSIDEYMERSQILSSRIQEAKMAVKTSKMEYEIEEKRENAKVEIIPNVEYVLDVYRKTNDPKKQNELLKTVLEYATYRKEVGGRWNPDAIQQFTLKLYPKLPN